MRWPFLTVVCVVACTAVPGAETAEAQPRQPKSAPPAASSARSPSKAPAAGKPAASGPAAKAPEAKKEPPAPSACPADMQLVEGEYCTEVEHECLKSWYDQSNRKTVCEEFAPKARCKGERIRKRYCIDTYEWPNQKGERPEVMNNFYQAQVKCAAVGKRMCTESEWTLACEGPEMKPFPYGYVRDPRKCNGDHPWDSPNMTKVAKRDPEELARLWRGVRSGSQPECVSAYGVADLPGNADEVVANETLTSDFKGKYSSVHTGGPWYKGVRNQCRPKIYTHEEGFYYYFLSFRCCSNPDGAENDPRTPKQIKSGQSFGTVERLARFTVAEMKEKLELKRNGKCECKPTDVLCKTMCGTLLGPGAKDATGDHLPPPGSAPRP